MTKWLLGAAIVCGVAAGIAADMGMSSTSNACGAVALTLAIVIFL